MARRVFIAERLESRLLLAADLGLGDLGLGLEPDAHILPVPGFVESPAAIGAPAVQAAPLGLGSTSLSGPSAPVSTGGSAGPARPASVPVVDEAAAAILYGCGHEGLSGATSTGGSDAFSLSNTGSTSHTSEHGSTTAGAVKYGADAASALLQQDGAMSMPMNTALSIGHLAGGEAVSAVDSSGMRGDGMLKDGAAMYAELGVRGSAAEASIAGGAAAISEALGTASDDAMGDMAGDLAAMNTASNHAMAGDPSDAAAHDDHASVDSLLAGWAGGEEVDSLPTFDANHAAIAARTAAELPTLIASNASPAVRDLAAAAKVGALPSRDAGPAADRAEIRLASTTSAARQRTDRSQTGFDAVSVAAAIAAIGAIGGTLLCELHLRRQRRLAEVEALVALSRRAA